MGGAVNSFFKVVDPIGSMFRESVGIRQDKAAENKDHIIRQKDAENATNSALLSQAKAEYDKKLLDPFRVRERATLSQGMIGDRGRRASSFLAGV